VVVSHRSSLAWLKTLPGGFLDLVIYHKHHYQRQRGPPRNTPTAVLALLRDFQFCSHGRLHLPRAGAKCPDDCRCGQRSLAEQPTLQYFANVPNYGLTHHKPYGGSREPYGFLQYVLDFWENLPPVTIFTQDDCLKSGCPWGMQLPTLGARLAAWPSEWGFWPNGQLMPIHRRNCVCRFTLEHNFASRGYFWYRWMSFAQQYMFGTVPENRSSRVAWPQDATFAVSRLLLRAQPRWMYEVLQRVTTVENACMGGSIMWAHALERLWFELLDTTVPKEIDYGQRGEGACFLGSRRRA